MKKVYILIGAIVATLGATAQSLTPTVIASSGAYVVNTDANISLSYTVGEMTMVETFKGNGNILTQGFQQPEDIEVGLLELAKSEFGSLVVYPNPAVDDILVAFKFPVAGRINISIFNELGQKVADIYNSNYTTSGDVIKVPTSVSNFAAGLYFMNMNFTADQDGKTHQISEKFQVIN